LREAKQVGQESLAHAAGLSVATYARIERAQVNPTWTTVRRVADALGLTLAELGAAIDAYEPPRPDDAS
jgi:transcriptional regulator with XRE-family HTH domain